MAPLYLVDFEGYRPSEELLIDQWFADSVLLEYRPLDEVEFMRRIYAKSGLDPARTFLPKNLHPKFNRRPVVSLSLAMDECRECTTGAVDNLLKKLGLHPKDIDILVTTCSIYCPTPSMASMLVNHYKMRSDIQSYHLAGMGCSNGVVAVNMIRDLLTARPNVNALVVTTETTTPARYEGQDRHRIVTNVIFRMGAAAILFSNKKSWGPRVKYELLHASRTHIGASDGAYRAIFYSPDDEGYPGVYLGKEVVDEAGKALTRTMVKVAPLVMTWRQVVEYLVHQWRMKAARKRGEKMSQYTPDFTQCLQHALIHAGGAKILDGIGKGLCLTEAYLKPSRAVLSEYGNVSSSSTWYALAWLESCQGVKKGDKVLQVGVGSGIKCGVNVWRAVRNVRDVHKVWEHAVPEEERLAVQSQGRGSFLKDRVVHQLVFVVVLLALLVGISWVMGARPPGATLASNEL